MALTNPTKYVSVQRLARFEQKLAAKYQTKAISAITGLSAETVEAALAELLGKIQAIPSAIIPKGSKAFAGLAPATDLAAGSLGFMWNITDAFTTTADFAEGAGHSIPAGANVYVANVGTAAEPSYKYDIFQGMYDLSGYALKSEMAITAVQNDATKKNIQLQSGMAQDVLVAHQDISGKADKIAAVDFSAEGTYAVGAYVKYDGKLWKCTTAHAEAAWSADDFTEVTGNFLGVDANGNLIDTGHKHADYQAAGSYKTTQQAVADPTVPSEGTTEALEFIDTITQDANGVITPTKKTVKVAAASTSGVGGNNGLMTAAQAEKLAGLNECSDDDIDSIFS